MDALRPLIVLAALSPAVAAQAVTVTVKAGTLFLKGSAGVDSLLVGGFERLSDGDGPDPVDVLITPQNDTTVNGSSTPALFSGVLAIKISLGGESDQLEIEDLAAPGLPLTVLAGPGDDSVELNSSTAGAFKFVGGSGDDSLSVGGSTLDATKITDTSGEASLVAGAAVFGSLTVKTGALSDSLSWVDVSVTDDLVVSVGGEDDVIAISGLVVGAEAILKLGAGSDGLVVDDSVIGASVNVAAGADDDSIAILDTIVGASIDVTLGSGVNLLSLIADDSSLQVGASVTVKGGADSDAIALVEDSVDDALTIGQDVILTLKSGANELHQLGDVVISNDLQLTAGGLAEEIDCDDLAVSHDVVFLLGAGTNQLVLNDCLIGNDLTITAGPDDDTVQLTGTTEVGGTETISLGGGET